MSRIDDHWFIIDQSTQNSKRLAGLRSFVNDDTGAIISTAAKFRSLMIANTSAFATAADRLRFYSLNLASVHLQLFSRLPLLHGPILTGRYVSTGARADRGQWRGGKRFVCGHLFHKGRGEHAVAVVPKRRAQRQHARFWRRSDGFPVISLSLSLSLSLCARVCARVCVRVRGAHSNAPSLNRCCFAN